VDFVSRVPLGSLQLAANSTPQSTKETRRLIFIDEGQDAVRNRVQAVKAIAQSEVSAIAYCRTYNYPLQPRVGCSSCGYPQKALLLLPLIHCATEAEKNGLSDGKTGLWKGVAVAVCLLEGLRTNAFYN
jgi:hypothetical protein